MNIQKVTNSILLVTLFVLVSTAIVNAQIGPPPAPSGSGAPLDPLSWILLGAGGAAAGKKYYNKKKQKKNDNENLL